MRRALASVLLAAVATWGCASPSADEKRAFLEAGRVVKLGQPPPTHAELRKEVGLFFENDLLLTFDKARAREAKGSSAAKIAFGAGAATVVAGATAGSLKDDGGAQAAVIGAGAAVMAGAALYYFGPFKSLHECQEFLSLKGAQLRQFEARNVGDSSDPVPAKTWREYVDLVTEVQTHESCLKVR